MNVHKVISFDPKKVWFETSDGKKICKKKTKVNEVESLLQASELLRGKTVTIFGKEYEILVPMVLDWMPDTSTLTMHFCEGINLESLLCDKQKRKYGVEVLQALMRFVIDNKFYWNDFAPRNVIISPNNIHIMDFENGISNRDTTTLADFLRMRVYREYSSFLLETERFFSVEEVFGLKTNEENEIIDVNSCSKRIIALAKAMGYYPTMTKQESLNIQKRVLISETPYISNGEILYPRIMIEELLESTGDDVYDRYVQLVLNGYKKDIDSNDDLEL